MRYKSWGISGSYKKVIIGTSVLIVIFLALVFGLVFGLNNSSPNERIVEEEPIPVSFEKNGISNISSWNNPNEIGLGELPLDILEDKLIKFISGNSVLINGWANYVNIYNLGSVTETFSYYLFEAVWDDDNVTSSINIGKRIELLTEVPSQGEQQRLHYLFIENALRFSINEFMAIKNFQFDITDEAWWDLDEDENLNYVKLKDFYRINMELLNYSIILIDYFNYEKDYTKLTNEDISINSQNLHINDYQNYDVIIDESDNLELNYFRIYNLNIDRYYDDSCPSDSWSNQSSQNYIIVDLKYVNYYDEDWDRTKPIIYEDTVQTFYDEECFI